MKVNIKHLATLANLPIDDAMAKKLEKQLEATLEHVESLNQLDTNNIEPTYQVTGLENITRDDLAKLSLSQKDATRGARKTHNGFFFVDAVLDADQ